MVLLIDQSNILFATTKFQLHLCYSAPAPASRVEPVIAPATVGQLWPILHLLLLLLTISNFYIYFLPAAVAAAAPYQLYEYTVQCTYFMARIAYWKICNANTCFRLKLVGVWLTSFESHQAALNGIMLFLIANKKKSVLICAEKFVVGDSDHWFGGVEQSIYRSRALALAHLYKTLSNLRWCAYVSFEIKL